MGTYKIQNELVNERIVYKHETQNHFLYWIPNIGGRWWVSIIMQLLLTYVILNVNYLLSTG